MHVTRRVCPPQSKADAPSATTHLHRRRGVHARDLLDAREHAHGVLLRSLVIALVVVHAHRLESVVRGVIVLMQDLRADSDVRVRVQGARDAAKA